MYRDSDDSDLEDDLKEEDQHNPKSDIAEGESRGISTPSELAVDSVPVAHQSGGAARDNTASPALLIDNDVVLTTDALDILGDDPSKSQPPDLTPKDAIASRWTHIFRNGIAPDELSTLVKKHQLLLAGGLSALGQDAVKILTALFNNISNNRRQLVLPLLSKPVQEAIENIPPGDLLFAAEIGKKIREAKSLEKVGRDICLTPRFHPYAPPKKGGGDNTKQPTPSSSGNRRRPAYPKREERPAKGQRPSDYRGKRGNSEDVVMALISAFHPYSLPTNLVETKRFILNLKYFNKFVDSPHFQMEDYRTVLRLIRQGHFMTTVDLKDAYFAVPIAETERKYLRFIYKGQLFEFNCLPFGLSSAPHCFTKIMKPVLAYFRREGIFFVNYLDDFIILAKNYQTCLDHTTLVVNTLQQLGFTINRD
nr:unnamed protein product [Callosobruchus analis]